MKTISCAELEVLLAEYLDETLTAADRAACQQHLAGCADCAALAEDVQAAAAWTAKAEAPVAPPWITERMTEKILRNTIYAPGPWARFMDTVGLAKVWAPRWILGLSMAALSLVMVNRFWSATENTVYRAWDRTVKSYDNMELVSSVQNQWEEWSLERSGIRGFRGEREK